MSYVILTTCVLAFPALALTLLVRGKVPGYRSVYLRFLAWLLAALLWLVAVFLLIPPVLRGLEPDRIIRVPLWPTLFIGLALVVAGTGLPLATQKPRSRPDRQALSGKEILGILLSLLAVYFLLTYALYTALPIVVFWIGTGVAASIYLGIFIGKVRATWRKPNAISWLPFLRCSPLLLGGLYLTFSSMDRYAEELSFDFHIRASASGNVRVMAWTRDRSALLVTDYLGRKIKELPEDIRMSSCEAWSRDGRHIYFSRSRATAVRGHCPSLWRYTPADEKMVFLRWIRSPLVRLSPDGKKVMFRGTAVDYDEDDEAHVSRQLIGGDTDSDEHDLVLCQRESDAVLRVWPEHCVWGPVTGTAYFPAPADTSLGEQAGLWSVDCSGDEPGDPVFILPRNEILRMTCNPSETHLAILSYVRLPRSRELRLEIVDLATHTAKRLPIEHPVAHRGWENSLAWDDSGMKLAFADRRGLNIYELATGELRLAFGSPSDVDYSWFLYPPEPLVPLTWLHSGELLLFQDERGLLIYEPSSGNTRLSPLGKRIREWLKGQKPLPRRYLPLWQSIINSVPAGSLTPHVLAALAGDAWPSHPAFAPTRIMGGGGNRR